MEALATIVNGYQPLDIVAKHLVLDVCGNPEYFYVHISWCSARSPVSNFSKDEHPSRGAFENNR